MTYIVRAFVIALTLAGTSTLIYTPVTPAAQASHPKTESFPIPMCPPSDPNACGIGRK